MGGMLLGHTTVCAVEIEEYPRQVLLQRQRDGILPLFPIWDDVCTFDGKPWRGKVDIICGGFPCQDISAAGNGGQLNPDWVEWLMGWPIGWTDLNPLETDRFLSWRRSHLGS